MDGALGIARVVGIVAVSAGCWSVAAWDRKQIPTKSIPCGTASRCSPNFMALRSPAALLWDPMPAGAS